VSGEVQSTHEERGPIGSSSRPPGAAAGFFFLGLGLTIAGSTAVTWAGYGDLLPRPLILAWLVAAAHGFLFAWFNRKAIGRDITIFLRWGLVMNVLRIVALLAVIFLAQFSGMENRYPFVVATLIGYFCFLFCEIAHLTLRNVKEDLH
jgi:hypothetical protein